MLKPDELFLRNLNILARLSSMELSEDIIEMYDRALRPFGYARAARACEEVALERRSRDPFPSIAELREKIDPTLNPKAEAERTASAIITAVRRHGYNWPQAFGDTSNESYRMFRTELALAVGEVGVAVIDEMGGWSAVAQEVGATAELTTIRAQLGRLAMSVIERMKHGKPVGLQLSQWARASQQISGCDHMSTREGDLKQLDPNHVAEWSGRSSTEKD